MTERSFAYPDYIGETDADTLDRAFERIIKALNNDAATFLFGAGMSVSSKVPTGAGILNSLLKLYFPDTGANPPDNVRLEKLASEFPFEAAVEAVEKNLGLTRDDLTEELKTLLLSPSHTPSEAHEDFLAVCFWGGRQRLDQVFTTNFDKLLEQVIGEYRAVSVTERNAKQIRKARADGLLPVLHLHGLLGEEYQITERDLTSTEYKVLNYEFSSALRTSDAFIFVGYSMNDPDFRNIYLNYRREIIDRRSVEKKTYVVSPAHDRYSYRLGKEVWRVRGADWIPLDAGTFFARLKHLLELRFEKETKESVKKKFNITDEQALTEMIARVAEAMRVEPSEALEFLNETRTRGGGK